MKKLATYKIKWIRLHRQFLSRTLALLFLVVIVYYIIENIGDFTELNIESWWLVAVIFVSVLVRNFATGLVMDAVLRPVNVNLSLTESFGLANLTRLTNQLLPGNVGIVMRSMYLKKRHNLSYASFVSTFAASQILLYLISSALGILAYSVVSASEQTINLLFLFVLVGVVTVLGGTLLIPKRWSERISHNRIRKAINGWYQIRADLPTFLRLTIASLLFITVSTIIMYANFGSLGWSISLWMALFFASINIMNTLIAFTPAGFGISEGVLVLLATSAGIPVSVALAVSLMQRVITFIAVIIVSPYFSHKLFGSSVIDLLRSRSKQTN